MLRKRISLFESSNDLLKEDCVWLFALCAVVETPLDADTCASLRCLLRRCAHLRASKAEVDDDVIIVLKQLAHERGVPLSALASELLRKQLVLAA